jgi:hypothetical protein
MTTEFNYEPEYLDIENKSESECYFCNNGNIKVSQFSFKCGVCLGYKEAKNDRLVKFRKIIDKLKKTPDELDKEKNMSYYDYFTSFFKAVPPIDRSKCQNCYNGCIVVNDTTFYKCSICNYT